MRGKVLERVEELYRDRDRRVKELQGEGKKVIGYFCCQVPLEFLTAIGLIPFRILGNANEPPAKADFYIEPVTCGYIRSCFDIADKGRYNFLDGLVSCRSCEGIEISFDLWRYYFRPDYAYHVDVPHKVSDWGMKFFREELIDFRRDLEQFYGGKITDEVLRKAIEIHNSNRRLVKDLYEFRKQSPPLISGTEIMKVMVVTMSLPPEETNKLLKDLISELKEDDKRLEEKDNRILLWGSIVDSIPLIQLIEECGGYVVIDDTCVGSRFYWPEVEITEDLIDGLAKRYLDGIVCPRTFRDNPGKTHKDDLENRFSYLKEFVREYNVNGAILQITRYCDTHGWEVPEVRSYLEDLGIQTLFLEHDYNAVALASLRTRIEAFMETL